MSTTWLDLQGWAGIKVRCRRDSGFLHFVFWLPVLLSLGVCSLCGGASHSVPVTTHTVVMRAKWNFLKLKLKKGSLLEAFQHLFGDIWWPNLWKEDWIYNFFIMTVHLTEPSWQLLFNIMLKFCHYISDPGAELLMAWLLFSNRQSVLFSSLAPWRLSLPHTLVHYRSHRDTKAEAELDDWSLTLFRWTKPRHSVPEALHELFWHVLELQWCFCVACLRSQFSKKHIEKLLIS